MSDTAQLQALVERCEGATKGSDTIDAMVLEALDAADIGNSRVSSSIDAALALVERVLPGASWEIRGGDDDLPTNVRLTIGDIDHELAEEDGATPALAIICALLRALIAQEALEL